MKIQIGIKQITDCLFAAIFILILSPIFILVAIGIKMSSKGPVFFKQQRLGKQGVEFTIYKFRTMVQNAERMGIGIYTTERDTRITRIGYWLRKTSLDELPQLFNILKGEMSFIGPRPPVSYHPYPIEKYTEIQKQRFQMRPGISGYAQVNGRERLTWEQKIEYDRYYVQNFSLYLDFKIFIKTIIIVLQMKNANDSSEKINALQNSVDIGGEL